MGERSKLAKVLGLGATGGFPRGQFSAADEGEIQFAVGVKDKTVIVDFGSPVKWLGMDGNDAIKFGEVLIKRGKEALESE